MNDFDILEQIAQQRPTAFEKIRLMAKLRLATRVLLSVQPSIDERFMREVLKPIQCYDGPTRLKLIIPTDEQMQRLLYVDNRIPHEHTIFKSTINPTPDGSRVIPIQCGPYERVFDAMKKCFDDLGGLEAFAARKIRK